MPSGFRILAVVVLFLGMTINSISAAPAETPAAEGEKEKLKKLATQ